LDTKRMLAEVEQEIRKLTRIADALRGSEPTPTSPSIGAGKGHSMSAASRRKISLAQKARWEKQRASGQTAARPKRTISAASRKRMAAAQKARWAKLKSKA
jgi:choline dehydrogenase-like flavoprotein